MSLSPKPTLWDEIPAPWRSALVAKWAVITASWGAILSEHFLAGDFSTPIKTWQFFVGVAAHAGHPGRPGFWWQFVLGGLFGTGAGAAARAAQRGLYENAVAKAAGGNGTLSPSPPHGVAR